MYFTIQFESVNRSISTATLTNLSILLLSTILIARVYWMNVSKHLVRVIPERWLVQNNFLNYFLIPKLISSPLVLEMSYVNDSFVVIGKLDNCWYLHTGHMLFGPNTWLICNLSRHVAVQKQWSQRRNILWLALKAWLIKVWFIVII